MKNCKQIATEWGLSERTVNDLCKKNKIDGAIKVGKMWKIPDDAKKPIDGRITSGKYVRHSAGVTRKPLPIGISDYVRAQADYYYVDKTMLIKEFLDQKPLVSLFTRPRRFGKTLNMDMLRVFFEISEENTSKYFEDKAIWQCGEEYRNQQGQYPVVFLTFKDVKFDSWKATLDKIRDLLQEEFGRHQELATSERIAEYEKTYFAKIINGDASEVDLTASLAKLSQMLTKHYGKAPIIIIDEYDTPIQEGYSKDFYDEIIGFMRNFFSGAFKDNKNLTYGFLTGILRIAQESIFSGLNNLTVNSVMDEEYDQFFGFTVSEVREMLKYYGVLDKEEELKCDSLAAQIERMLEELQDLINNIDAIHNLRTFLPQYTAAVKASDGTVSRRGGVAEFVNGNGGGFNHYSELKAYKPFYSRDLPSVAKWAKWRNDGIKQMCGNDCPFCTNILPSSIRSQNEIISKVFKNSALSVANAVLEYVQQAVDQGYILPDAVDVLESYIGDNTKADELYAELQMLAKETDYLYKKIEKICMFKPMNVTHAQLVNLEQSLSELVIEERQLQSFYATDLIKKLIYHVSDKINALKGKTGQLKGFFQM